MPYELIDLSSPGLGMKLLEDAKGKLPIDIWRCYVLQHDPHPFRAETDWSPPSVIHWCDEPHRSTLDPQKAVDDAFGLLARLLFISPPRSYPELVKGILEALSVLLEAESSGRKRGQPTSMQRQAVRAYIIRKFNPVPQKPEESAVSWSELADVLLNENGKCPRCRIARHRYDSGCVKALITAVTRLHAAMKLDRIPI
jgi:hypothetical protein